MRDGKVEGKPAFVELGRAGRGEKCGRDQPATGGFDDGDSERMGFEQGGEPIGDGGELGRGEGHRGLGWL